MYDVIGSMKAYALANDMQMGEVLKQRYDALIDTFRGFGAPNYNQRDYCELLADMEAFEERVMHVDVMHYFYGYMGRIALNCQDFDKAMIYALAGYELCSERDDEQGVWSVKMLLCDIALCVGSSRYAAIYYLDCNAGSRTPFPVHESMEDDDKFKKMLLMKKRPKSFSALQSTDSVNEEGAIRLIMAQMKVSRRTAKKYFDDANKIKGY